MRLVSALVSSWSCAPAEQLLRAGSWSEQLSACAAAARRIARRAGIMPITYIPADFWGVACTVTGSAIPKVTWRSTYMGIPAVLAALCGHFRHELSDLLCEEEQCVYDVPSSFITPFALLVALLTSYRVRGAHAKWDNANKMAMSLHEVRECCAPCPTDPQHLSSPTTC